MTGQSLHETASGLCDGYSKTSLRLNVPDYLAPFFQLNFYLLSEFGWRAPNRIEAERYQSRPYVRERHSADDFAVE